ncbi:hypothetical protein ACS0TY_000073 [Phlomoides rotata]
MRLESLKKDVCKKWGLRGPSLKTRGKYKHFLHLGFFETGKLKDLGGGSSHVLIEEKSAPILRWAFLKN